MKILSIILLTNELQQPKQEDFISKVIPNFWAFLVQLIAFIIMILIVIKFAYKPIAKFLQKRKEYIESNLKEAGEKNEEASRNLEESKSNLRSSQVEAVQIIQNAKIEAEKERSAILEETNQDIAAKRMQAQEDLELEKNKALKEMHDDVVDIAMEATKNILNREVTETDDKHLLDDFVDDLIEEKVENK